MKDEHEVVVIMMLSQIEEGAINFQGVCLMSGGKEMVQLSSVNSFLVWHGVVSLLED